MCEAFSLMICMYSKGIGFGVKQQPIQIVVSYDVTGHPVYPGVASGVG